MVQRVELWYLHDEDLVGSSRGSVVHEANPLVLQMLRWLLKGLKLMELIEVELLESVVHESVAEKEVKSQFLFEVKVLLQRINEKC